VSNETVKESTAENLLKELHALSKG